MRLATRLVLTLCGAMCGGALADEPAANPGPPGVRRQVVPEDDRSAWPAGEWIPLDRAVWERYLDARLAAPDAVEPPQAFLRRAVYVGRLTGDVLQGECTFDIGRRSTGAGEVVLHPLRLYLTDVCWPDRPAVWGARPDGRTALWSDEGDEQARGVWELAGERMLDRLEFAFETPAASLCELQLELPRDLVLSSTAGLVTGPDPLPGGVLARWIVQPGRRTDFKLICGPALSRRPARTLQVRQTLLLRARRDGLDAQYDLELETPGDSPLSFLAPPRLEVHSASIGADVPLPVQTRLVDDQRQVTIELPDSRLPRGARIRVRGFQPLDWRTPQPLPIPRLVGGEVLEQQVQLQVLPPYRLNDLRLDGYRVTDRSADSEQVESWSFQALRPDPELTVHIAAPDPELSFSSVTWVDYSEATPRLRSRVRVRGGGGSTYLLQAAYPASWDVVAVESPRGEAGGLADYRTAAGSGGEPSILTVELRKSLDAEETIELLLTALGPAPRLGANHRLPLLNWENAAQQSGVLAVRPPTGLDVNSPLQTGAPVLTPEQSQWLEEFSGGSAPALVLDRLEVLRRPELATLQFEAAAAVRDPLSEISGAAVETKAAEPATSSETWPLPIGLLELTTRLAPGGRREHWHTARFLVQSTYSGECEFTLDPEAGAVELEIDDQSTPLVRNGPVYRSAHPVAVRRELVIHYQTPAAEDSIGARSAVAVPAFEGVRPSFDWRIQPSETCACSRAELPFARVRSAVWAPLEVRFLGPLARDGRPGGDAVEADGELRPGGEPAGTSIDTAEHRGILRVEAALAPEQLTLETWNPARTDGASWAALSLVLLLVVAVRRQRSPRWNRLAPLWISGMLLAAWQAPEPLARIAGAGVVATGLGISLPRRVALGRSTRSTSPRQAQSGSPAPHVPVAAGSAGLLLLAAFWTTSRAQEPARTSPPPGAPLVRPTDPAGDVEVLTPERDGSPSPTVWLRPESVKGVEDWRRRVDRSSTWLIRAADYQLTLSTITAVTATFEVLVRPTGEGVTVRLPLGNIAFDTASSVRIDGREGAIIPASVGDGFFVTIPPHPRAAVDDAAGLSSPQRPPEWEVHQVEVRGFAVAVIPPGPEVKVRVPRIASARAHIGGDASGLSQLVWRGIGSTERVFATSSAFEVRLGPRAVLDATRIPGRGAEAAPTIGAPVLTTVEFHPLRLEGETTLTLPTGLGTSGRSWSIPLAADVVVTDVAAGGELQWWVGRQDGELLLQIVAAAAPPAPLPATIRFARPANTSRDPDRALRWTPALRLRETDVEWLQMRPAAGFELEPLLPSTPDEVQLGSVRELPPELAAPMVSPRSLLCRLAAGQSTPARLRPRECLRAAAWDGSIQVDRMSAEWTAGVQLEVSGAPAAMHEFRIDPRVRIENVAALQDGADRLARFHRDGDRLLAVLTRPYSGQLRIELRGRLPFNAGSNVLFPEATLLDTTSESFSWAVTNRSGWEMHAVYPAADDASPAAAANPGPGAALLTFSGDDPNRPAGFRLTPGPDAAEVELVTLILLRGEEGWWQRTVGLVRPQGAPLQTVQFRLPPAAGDRISLSPPADVLETSPQPDGSTLVRMQPSRLRNGVYRFVVESRLTVPEQTPLWEWPRLVMETAQASLHLILLDRRFPYRLTSASGEEMSWERVPARLSVVSKSPAILPLRAAVASPVWTWTRFNQEAPETHVPLLETLIWWDVASGLRGTTAMTFVTSNADRLQLRLPPPLELDRVTLEGVVQPARMQGDRLELQLPARHRGAPLLIHWQARRASGEPPPNIPLPEPIDWSPAEHVAAFLRGEAAPMRLAEAVSPVAWHSARMSGLVGAVEQQSTRTFALDSPLLTEVRETDALLERLQRTEPLTPQDAARVRELRSRWLRLQPLIAVRVSPPGEGPSAATPDAGRLWSPADAGGNVDLAIPGPQATSLAVLHFASWTGQGGTIAAFLGLLLTMMWLQRRRVTERLADWLARHPALTCLLLGGVWIAYLSPRAVGVAILIAGMTLASRRPQPTAWRSDTALVGPGQ